MGDDLGSVEADKVSEEFGHGVGQFIDGVAFGLLVHLLPRLLLEDASS